MRKVIVGLLAILFAFQTSIFVTGEETEQILEECQLNFDGLNANQSDISRQSWGHDCRVRLKVLHLENQ